MIELQVLQAVALKGRVNAMDVAATVDGDPAEVASTIDKFTAAGLLSVGRALRISPEGRMRLGELLDGERSGADHDALVAAYNEFRSVNHDFKTLISDWQLRDGAPNEHDDADYDASVLARLDRVHARVVPLIEAVGGQLPRLRYYSRKLSDALDRVKSGETSWLTKPVVDSYHTVWFELHEELIGASGLTRLDEARAGHA